MRASLHYVLVLVGLIVLALIIGSGPALWVALALFVTLATHGMGGVIARADEYASKPYTLQLIWLSIASSIVLAVLSAVLLFVARGWMASLGFVLLYVGYFLTREDGHARWRREATKVRASLVELVAQRVRGGLTQEQLERQAFVKLERDLPERVYGLNFLYDPFISEDGMSPREHQIFLKLLEQHLSRTERLSVYSGMHTAVRARLGLRPYG